MRLTHFSDIGLKVLMYLAKVRRGNPPVTANEISIEFNVKKNHMTKVVALLAKNGWIKAIRGRNGGILLAVEPSSLKLGVVLRVLEGHEEVIECESSNCRISKNCGLRRALRSALNAFYESMDLYSLADIVEGNSGSEIQIMHQHYLKSYHGLTLHS